MNFLEHLMVLANSQMVKNAQACPVLFLCPHPPALGAEACVLFCGHTGCMSSIKEALLCDTP